ncbi:M50 family metallopeptidase [Bacillus norwichensis]|uniref:M50 family metallopeptidase n=1 Tax=Bacillus norwichensis TaxID=2762217 RepID=A0ABR8VFY4_9BACI|nr:M50 family metallopeptidase [Bacillus norwichensis]MBD8003691.1 M50 family metallopeptidase [Bacillus norwichensis]
MKQEEPSTNPKKRNWKQLVLGLTIGIGLWPVFLPYLYKYDVVIDAKNMLVISAAMFVSIFIALIIHECGHAVAGKAAGMVFMNISIGPFVYVRSGDRTLILFQMPALGYMGRAMLRFPDRLTDKDLIPKLKLYILGGPLVNLLTAVIAILLVYTKLPSGILLTFGMINLLFGSINLIPTENNGMQTDGRLLAMLSGKQPGKELVLLSYRMMQEDPEGTDWRPETVQAAEEAVRNHSDHPIAGALFYSLASHYLMMEKAANAEAIGRIVAFRTRSQKVDPLQDMADIAMIHILHQSDNLKEEPGIREKLAVIGTTEKVTRHFRDAYTAYLDNNRNTMMKELDVVEKILGKWHSLYLEGHYEKKRIEEIRASKL